MLLLFEWFLMGIDYPTVRMMSVCVCAQFQISRINHKAFCIHIVCFYWEWQGATACFGPQTCISFIHDLFDYASALASFFVRVIMVDIIFVTYRKNKTEHQYTFYMCAKRQIIYYNIGWWLAVCGRNNTWGHMRI